MVLGNNNCHCILLTVMLIEWLTVLWASTTIVRRPPIPWLALITTWGSVTRMSAPTLPLPCMNTILTPGNAGHDMSVNIMLLKKFSNIPSARQVNWVQFGFLVQFVSQSGFTLLAIWSRSQVCMFDVATENSDNLTWHVCLTVQWHIAIHGAIMLCVPCNYWYWYCYHKLKMVSTVDTGL